MGLRPIAVWTIESEDPYVAQTFREEDYAAVHRHKTMAETVEFLKDQAVVAVVPGDQTALEWSDLFAQAIGVTCNPVDSMNARFNKRIMKERWTKYGVPCADGFESSDLTTVLSWVAEHGFPVVLKPNSSTGACHVFVCTDVHEVSAAFTTITTEPDEDGKRYEGALVEEYLDGPEYFINLLHDGSNSSIVAAARYDKIQRDGHPSVYRNIRSIPLDHPVVTEALPHVQAASDALDVRIGINDAEFKMTSQGFRVIEVNNRLPGAGTPDMIRKCSGLNCYQETVRLYLDEYVKPAKPYRFDRGYCVCLLINDRAGRVAGYTGVDDVTRLPSFDDLRLIAQPGMDWPVTIALSGAWGLVWLVHEDEDQLDRDSAAVHALLRLRMA
jgi:biotin carboxylase